MSAGIGKPKYGPEFIENRDESHILRAPYQSVMIPSSEKVFSEDVLHEQADGGEYLSDFFNAIPIATNIAASVGFGYGPMNNNAGIKRYRKPGKAKGGYRPEPLWNPEGGWQFDWSDMKLPEDYYAENRRGVRYTELPENIEHWEDPLVVHASTGKFRLRERDLIPIVPTAVYETNDLPFIGEPSKPVVFKGATAVSSMTSEFEAEELPNPTQTTKYIQNKNILQILPPVYSTSIQMGETRVPLRLKDPRRLVLQAYDSQPIDVPMPNGTSIKLKDYRWKVVQAVDGTTELIFEIPPQLKDRPDVAYTVSQISSAYEGTVDTQTGRVFQRFGNVQNAPVISTYEQAVDTHTGRTVQRVGNVQNAPVVSQVYNQFIESGMPSELAPSKVYYNVDNALEVFPEGLAPVRAEIRSKPQMYVQPEPNFTYPWMF